MKAQGANYPVGTIVLDDKDALIEIISHTPLRVRRGTTIYVVSNVKTAPEGEPGAVIIMVPES